MTTTTCDQQLSFERFVDYFFGDLPAGEELRLEEHLFGCAVCAERAERWGNDLQAMRSRTQDLPRGAFTRDEVSALGDRAVVIDVPQAPRVDVRLANLALHVFHVHLEPESLRGVDRVDVEYVKPELSDPIFYVASVPFEQSTGDVFLACHEQVLRSHGDSTIRIVGTERGRARTLFETEVRFV